MAELYILLWVLVAVFLPGCTLAWLLERLPARWWDKLWRRWP